MEGLGDAFGGGRGVVGRLAVAEIEREREVLGARQVGRQHGADAERGAVHLGQAARGQCQQSLVERHPWLPGAVFKAFGQAKAAALEALSDTSATKVTLPFVEEQLKAARETMGEDYWSYGVDKNRATLETFLRHHHAQGLSSRRLSVDEIFHPATYETYAI